MDKLRRKLAAALALAPMLPAVARAQDGAGYTTLKKELPVDAAPGKIEVAEFFWYGCIHCYNLEPLLETWIPKLPPDVQFRRIPAVFNERWALDAAIFYSFESLGVLEKAHRPFFDAIHKDHLRTDNPQALAEWLTRNGIDLKRFDAANKSFGVQSKVKRASQLTSASQIDGTPALMVHGRYTVGADQGREIMLATAERLVAMVRKSGVAAKH